MDYNDVWGILTYRAVASIKERVNQDGFDITTLSDAETKLWMDTLKATEDAE